MAGKKNGQKNGHTNGSLNGLSQLNGKSETTRQRTPPIKRANKKNGFLARIINITARLLTWYSIISILFRCPASITDLTETSPKVCKPYFQLKEMVSPHLTPYYDAYAAPYVELAKPYYSTVNQTVITPARTYAVKYGGPQLEKAQTLSKAQWEKTVQPQLVKYQALAKVQYDKNAAPHVNKATEMVAPYYTIAKSNAQQTYNDVVLPAYLFVQPYALQGYGMASTFTVDTAVPTTLWAWNKTYVFLDGVVWPRARNVYVKTVDPQVARIMERLGRHQDKRAKTFNDENDSSSLKSSFVKPTTSISSSVSTTATTKASEGTPEPEYAASSYDAEDDASASVEVKINPDGSEPSKDDVRAAAAKTVADDLELWQGKFTKAAEESAEEIEGRVQDIADRLIQEEAGVVGKSHLTKLDETVKTELSDLKKNLLSILEKHRDAGAKTDASQLEEEVASAVRASGLKIRDQAQAIRTWRQKYEEETEEAVTAIAQEHISILESIRDLALQKLGMKWAWMDGVTYKDWQKYHQLRARLDEWTDDLKVLVTTHPSLPKVQTAGADIENEGMAVAAEAAQELGSLKQVVAWKAVAGDYTNDFDASTMKLAAEAAEKKAADALKEAADDAQEVMQSAAGKVKESVASAGEAISEGASSAVKPSSAATSGDAADAETSAVPPMDSMASEPTESASDLFSSSSKSASTGTNAAESVEPLPTPEVVDGPEQVEESIVASPDQPSSSAGSATPSVKSAMFGAMAQSVPSRKPVMDDYDEEDGIAESFISNVKEALPTDAAAGVTSAAQAAYTSAIAQAADKYSSAMSMVSVQVSGTPKPAHEQMFSSVSQGYFEALATANSRLQNAATAASEGIYGTPTTKWMPNMPTVPSVDWERVQSIAQQNLQDSVSWAGEQFENAKVAIGAAEPTPSTPSERAAKMLDQAKHNYYAGLGVAHARYEEFLSAASTAVSSMTATPTPTDIQGTASSVASVAGESASSVAAAASGAAASAASVASEAAASAAAAAGDTASAAGDSVAANWDFLVSQVSSQVYGAPTPTPWYENLYSAAGDYAAQAGDYAASATGVAADYAANAGDLAADSLSSANKVAGEYAGSATDAAATQYSVVSSLVSELIVGKEPTVTESVFARLAGVYGAASSTAASAMSEATEAAASAASNVADSASSMTELVKETVDHIRDEL
ncbi:Transcription factor [Apiospora saccharicola]|uniref:Transcription factor n=1 Tax=Apiospora saccharicola TaxID=335842 RepID=A0ABR1WCL7_9PEZI